MVEQTLEERINQRRRQILVHSVIYYRFNENIIPDYVYDAWSKELADLQKANPETASKCVYADAFKDFDGSSGFDLPLQLPEIVRKASQLLNYHKGRAVYGKRSD